MQRHLWQDIGFKSASGEFCFRPRTSSPRQTSVNPTSPGLNTFAASQVLFSTAYTFTSTISTTTMSTTPGSPVNNPFDHLLVNTSDTPVCARPHPYADVTIYLTSLLGATPSGLYCAARLAKLPTEGQNSRPGFSRVES